MDIIVDEDVKAVVEMMVQNIPAERLVSVANGVQKLPPFCEGNMKRLRYSQFC